MEKNTENTLKWVILFSIAMGVLESAVVVYLREIYYPNGFAFPLKSIIGHIALTEIMREASTLIMLLAIGYLAGTFFTERFAYFILTFAIWDIVYYVFLKILLNWPESLMTWDILFLIPLPWVGPVIAPVILSLMMIVFASLIIYFSRNNDRINVTPREWFLLVLGSLIVIISFCWDYSAFILNQYSLSEAFSITNRDSLLTLSSTYVPDRFTWWPFLLGFGIIISGIGLFTKRNTHRTVP